MGNQESSAFSMTALIAFHIFFTKLEHQNCYHAGREEMPGLQEVKKSGKRTLLL
jgi:hypothetical protein